ncbi:MAG: fibronectin type III domain-containing protein [Bacteroidales bacterium]|nr:fibronectin type III domain-containing protein [Bacteroidales bacterium]
MNNSKIIFAYDRMPDAELSNKAQNPISAMTENPSFSEPTPSLASVQAILDSFRTALTAAQSGDRTKIAIKNEKREILIDTLHSLGRYAEMAANGNRSILLSSGFDISKERSSTVELGQPENVRLSDGGNIGEIIVACSSVAGVRSYLFQYTADPLLPDSVWVSNASTKSEYVIRGLKSSTKYWCRVVAIGSNDQQTVSNPVARIVQ